MNFLNFTSPIAKPSVTKKILEENNTTANKKFGQNFLISNSVINNIGKLASIKKGDNVIEIGPGLGVLTVALLNAGCNVLAIEADTNIIPILKSNVKNYCKEQQNSLTIIEQDALKINYKKIDDFFGNNKYKLVSNLPYNVAAPILINYFQNLKNLDTATVMIQKEIANRILAKPKNKNYGAFTVKLSMYASAKGTFDVSPNNFYPAPKVNSSVIRLNKKEFCDYELLSNACKIADAAFAYRRKTINNSINTYYKNDKSISHCLIVSFKKCGIDVSFRAETLTYNDYINVAKCLTF